jgi:hypothetical protein
MTRALLLGIALIALQSAPAPATEPQYDIEALRAEYLRNPAAAQVREDWLDLSEVFAAIYWLKTLDANWVKNGGKITADVKQAPPENYLGLQIKWPAKPEPPKDDLDLRGKDLSWLTRPAPTVYRNATWQEVAAVRGLSGVPTYADRRTSFPVTHNPPSRSLLPPDEYDVPYNGRLTVTLVNTERGVAEQCPKTWFPAKLGCAYMLRETTAGGPYEECRLILASEEIIESWGFTLASIYRHEIAHCNGWPNDHKGARVAP